MTSRARRVMEGQEMKRVTVGCLLIAAVLLTHAAAQAPATATGATLFEGARLITGDGNAPIENSAFLVENNRFSRVGRKGELQVPAGAVHVDLKGKTVMPTMADVHGHFGFQHVAEGTM